jgi:hypothetical protein
MKTTDEKILFVHDNGQVSCVAHGGSYLRSEVENGPKAATYWTPLGTWEVIDAEFAEEWVALVGSVPTCETCRYR